MEDLSVDDQAATKVQTLYRGHAARKKTEQLKYGVARKNVCAPNALPPPLDETVFVRAQRPPLPKIRKKKKKAHVPASLAESFYLSPPPPASQVNEYLQKHKIHDLLQHLVSLVAYHRPDDPKQYLQKEIATLQAAYACPSRMHPPPPPPPQLPSTPTRSPTAPAFFVLLQTGTRRTSSWTTTSTPCSE